MGSCLLCGEAITEDQESCDFCGKSVPRELDELDPRWVTGIWCSTFLPIIGPWIVIVLSSWMYYAWKHSYPERAKAINGHGWRAFVVGILAQVIVVPVAGVLLYLLLMLL